MRPLRVEIDRLNIALDGFAGASDDAAMEGIERELRRAVHASIVLEGDLAPDAAALRAAIIENAMDAIRSAAAGSEREAP